MTTLGDDDSGECDFSVDVAGKEGGVVVNRKCFRRIAVARLRRFRREHGSALVGCRGGRCRHRSSRLVACIASGQ